MGLFDKIKSAIWGSSEEAAPATIASVTPTSVAVSATGAAPVAPVAPPAGKPVTTAQAPAPQPAPTGAVDVSAILDAAVKASGQKLDWKKSIVDLLKALKLDSSLGARKELADELGYTGDKNDSAKMNMWLHKQVIQKLKDNGGQVPADLL